MTWFLGLLLTGFCIMVGLILMVYLNNPDKLGLLAVGFAMTAGATLLFS